MGNVIDNIRDFDWSVFDEIVVVMPLVFFRNIKNMGKIIKEVPVINLTLTSFACEKDRDNFITYINGLNNTDKICVVELCTSLPEDINSLIDLKTIKKIKVINFKQVYSE